MLKCPLISNIRLHQLDGSRLYQWGWPVDNPVLNELWHQIPVKESKPNETRQNQSLWRIKAPLIDPEAMKSRVPFKNRFYQQFLHFTTYQCCANYKYRLIWLDGSTAKQMSPSSSTALGPVVQTSVRANLGLNINPGFFFLLSKALSGILFSILFRVSNHQIVGKEN